MKRLLLLAAILGASFSAACSSGGGSIAPPPPPVGFSNSSLKGSYGFSMVGSDPASGAQIARIGSFNADGNGNITAALEDLTDAGSSSAAIQFSGGTYAIDSAGKGTVNLTSVAGTGLMLSVVMTSPSGGLMIESDLNFTSSGTFSLQNPTAFSQTGLTNGYVFDVSGVDANSAPVSIVGNFQVNGGGGVTACLLDENDGSSPAPSGALACTTPGTYTLDPTNGSTFGRGTLSFAGLSFAFYIVNSTQLELMEEDAQFATSGSATQMNNPPAQVAAASYAFLVGGASVLGNGGVLARGGRFTTDATGASLTNIFLDDNNTGGITSINGSNTITNAKFAIDTTNPGTGRGTLTFLASGQSNPFTFVFYLASPNNGFIQDTSNGVIADGSILLQSGPFSSLSGNYAVNWSGVTLSQTNNFEEDFVGQYALSSSNSVSGAIDFVELGSTSGRIPLFSNISLTGTFTPASDATLRNTYAYTANASPATTFNFAAYIGGTASAPTILLVNTNQNRTDAGTASLQNP
jgi:hypothetical protein